MIAKITNINGRTFEVKKDTEQEILDFIEYQKSKKHCPYGKLEQVLEVNEGEYPDRAEFVQTVTRQEPVFDENYNIVMQDGDPILDENGDPVLDEEGNPLLEQVQVFQEVTKHQVRIPQEFTVVIEEDPIEEAPILKERDRVLKNTDWLFVSDLIIPTEHRNIYKDYRQMLRDYDCSTGIMFESFENYVNRLYPHRFLEGGDGQSIINKFGYYL